MTDLFSILDQAAERFIDPFPAPTVGVALREFEQACRTEGHQFRKFPEDYALYHVGEFDPEIGELKVMKPRKLAVAASYAQNPQIDVERDIGANLP